MTEAPAPQLPPQIPRRITFYRHAMPVRLTHWVGVIVLAVLLMSGLQIFNAHPALYWGRASDFAHPIASIGAKEIKGRPIGVTQVFGHPFDTTGVLGVSGGYERGFPAWATLPSYQDLSTGRRWHFFFAWLLVLNGLAYLVYGFASGHVWRDLIPSRGQLRHIGASLLDHLRLRFPRGEEARRYNVLQRLSYLAIIFVVVPLLPA
jgi:thiosulfate reductase cytochrome b subunit